MEVDIKPLKRQRSNSNNCVRTVVPKYNVYAGPRAGGIEKVYQSVARTRGGQVQAESHYFDTERTVTLIPVVAASWIGTEMDPNTTAMLSLFNPTVGNDISQREARKVFVKKITISGIITTPAQAAGAPTPDTPIIRMLAFQDKQTNATQASPSLVLNSGAGSDPLHMFQSTASFGRFKVFKDKTFLMPYPDMCGVTGSINYSTTKKNFKLTFKPMCYVNYNATNGGTVADVIDNSFHFAINQVAGAAQASVMYKVRTVFSA